MAAGATAEADAVANTIQESAHDSASDSDTKAAMDPHKRQAGNGRAGNGQGPPAKQQGGGQAGSGSPGGLDPLASTHKAEMNITVDGKAAGKVVLGLFGNSAPKTVQNVSVLAHTTSLHLTSLKSGSEQV